ncbi:MAG: hypothetical protein J6P19_06395 [Acetobacter sp.]|nr:hypothetical protein [Acetobacter sp.]
MDSQALSVLGSFLNHFSEDYKNGNENKKIEILQKITVHEIGYVACWRLDKVLKERGLKPVFNT